MKRYRVTYEDSGDPGNRWTTIIKAYDREHLEQIFHDPEDPDWVIVKVELARDPHQEGAR